MKKLTAVELEQSAKTIVGEIQNCDTEQRWELYSLVAGYLSGSGQNYQAAHFSRTATAELGDSEPKFTK